MSVDGTKRQSLVYDEMGRLVKKTIGPESGNPWTTEYTYAKGSSQEIGSTTLLIESVKDRDKTFYYEYDQKGNIVKVEEQSGTGAKTVKALYDYDSLGQLIREDNKWIDRTVTYTYDQGGNMLTKRYYPYAEERSLGTEYTSESRAYEYSTGTWKDQLTSFNGEGIGSYDAVGNPCSYRGKTLTWTDGRKLSTVKNGGTEAVIASYTYDQNGDRIKKTVGNTVTKFHTDNGRILIMEKGGKEVHFFYDQDGSLFSMKVVDGTSVTDYYYEKNLQGDVVGLIDSTGTRKVNYSYDSWGRPVSMTDNSGTGAGSLNPFRYRGYFYDDETGWYYLKSRYYDPEVGRFLNADAIDVLEVEQNSIVQYNLYVYCLNNPIIRVDIGGQLSVLAAAIIGGALAGAIVSAFSYLMNCEMYGTEFSGWDFAKTVIWGAACGAVGGAISIPCLDVGTKILMSFGTGVCTGLYSYSETGNGLVAAVAGVTSASSCYMGSMVDVNYTDPTLFGAETAKISTCVGLPWERMSSISQDYVSDKKIDIIIDKPQSSYLTGSSQTRSKTYKYVKPKKAAPKGIRTMRGASYFQNFIL